MPQWGKIFGGVKAGAQLGSLIGVPFAAQLIQAMHIVEVIPNLKGADKKAAAKAIALELVGDDGLLSRDTELAAIVDAFIDDYVRLMNRLALLRN